MHRPGSVTGNSFATQLPALPRSQAEDHTHNAWDEQGVTKLQCKLFAVESFGDREMMRGILLWLLLLAGGISFFFSPSYPKVGDK